jgi:hypothetical protein
MIYFMGFFVAQTSLHAQISKGQPEVGGGPIVSQEKG